MAGRTNLIKVAIIGDASGLTSGLKKGQGALGGFSKAFGPLIGQSGVLGDMQAQLAGVGDALDVLGKKGASTGTKLAGIGGIGAGIGLGLTTLGAAGKQAGDQLSQAITNAGQDYSDYEKQIESAVKHQEGFGNSAIATKQALATLTQATNDPAKALHYLGTVSDYAAAKHVSLQAAADQLAKVYTGKGARALASFGITMDKSIKDPSARGEKALDQLAQKVQGQAAKSVDNFGGELRVLRTQFLDGAESIGQRFGPALTGLGVGIGGLGVVMNGAGAILSKFKTGTEAATAATEAMTGAEDAAAVSEGVALLPILAIIAGVALLGVGIFELAKHWKAIWGGIKAVLSGVFDWVKGHWPLLLAILTGPIGLATLFIIDHFQSILGFVTSMPGKIVRTIAGIPGDIIKLGGFFLSAGVSLGAAILQGMVHGIQSAVSGVTDIAREIVNAVIGFINNNVIGPIRDFHFKVLTHTFKPFGSFPTIPTLHGGGIFDSGDGEGLALLSDGEGVFTPKQMAALGLLSAGGGGGQVIINLPPGVDPAAVTRAQNRYTRRNGTT